MPKCCRVLAVGCEIYTKPRGQLFDVMLCMGDKLGGLFVHNLLRVILFASTLAACIFRVQISGMFSLWALVSEAQGSGLFGERLYVGLGFARSLNPKP